MNGNANSPIADEGPSIIGSGIFVHGNIEADIDLRIRGKVDGDVRCATLVLGDQGEIRGNVVADRVRLSGLVEGAIETGDLALEDTARVHGDITYSRIRMVKGAVVHGRMSHVAREDIGEAEPARAAEAPQPQTPPSRGGKVQKAIYIE
ncbi:MAG TPA: polymer-forming cytoskeletal protein [Allosphingosinicella sp.]|jgi:cytoskeletal protein CcmA (bactofilin family)